MPLNFHPKPGMVLMCDYNTGFIPPEMIKKRPVVVISPRPRRKNQLCIVVPLSTTCPEPLEPHHHKMDSKSLPGRLSGKETWAKCDMLATVSLNRLDRVYLGKNSHGKRIYIAHIVTADDMLAIRRAVLAALGLQTLTDYL